MYLSNIKYGVDIQIDGVTISPFSTDASNKFVWDMGTVHVAFSQQEVSVSVPRGLDENAVRVTPFEISSLLPNTTYQLSVQGESADCALEAGTAKATADAAGVLTFAAPVGYRCTVTATKA